ncbi:MAG: hypothetical protein AAB388_01200 [Patescibacteria group bacterium]
MSEAGKPKKARLPSGREVDVFDVSSPTAFLADTTGYISPKLLAPDLTQSREYQSPARLAELEESVGNEGVRQDLIITPVKLCPWRTLPEEYRGLPYLIVSGHRRQASAVRKEVSVVPFRVEIYASKREHELALVIYNEGHEDLTPIEEGKSFAKLLKAGFSQNEISKKCGHSLPYVIGRIHLTNLHPSIQKLMHPTLAEKGRLPIGVGSALGELAAPSHAELTELILQYEEAAASFGLAEAAVDEETRRFDCQRLLLAEILRRKMSALRAIQFIKTKVADVITSRGGFSRSVKRAPGRPDRRRQILDTTLRAAQVNAVADWSEEDWRRVFMNASYEDVIEVIAQVKLAEEVFKKFRDRLEASLRTKKPTRTEVLVAIGRVAHR